MTRIEAIELTPVSVPFTRPERWALGEHGGMTSLIVELHTEDGTTGLGEILPVAPGPKALTATVEELSPLLIGHDARDINRNVSRILYEAGWYMFERSANLVIAGLEMAMWDVLGKSVGEPLHRLFGGALRDRQPYVYYLQASGRSVAEMADEAVEAVASGYDSFFFKGGWDEERDVELVATLRERVGPRPRLRLDPNEAWTVGTAVRMMKRLEPFDLEFVEQPVRMDDIEALVRLRHASGVAIGANQGGWTSRQIFEIAKRGAADVIVTDPHQEGGLAALRRSIAICEVAGLPVAHHAFSGLTIAMTAAMHVYAASPNCGLVAGQAFAPGFLTGDVTTTMFSAEGGSAAVPSAPGIGVELDRDRLASAHKAYLEGGAHSFFDEADIGWLPRR